MFPFVYNLLPFEIKFNILLILLLLEFKVCLELNLLEGVFINFEDVNSYCSFIFEGIDLSEGILDLN